MDPRHCTKEIQDCEAAATRLRAAGASAGYVEKLRRLVELYLAADGYEPAVGYLDELIARSGELGLAGAELALLYAKKAEVLRVRGCPSEARECCARAEELVAEGRKSLAYAKVKMTSASILSDLGQYAEALCRCREALPVLKGQARQRELAELECRLGRIKARTGDVLAARDHFEQGLCLFREADDAVGAGRAYNNLGVVYKTLCQWDRAVECFRRALETARKNGEARSVCTRLLNLGVSLLKAGRWAEARAYLAESLKRSTSLGNRPGVIRASIALGNLLRLERQWKAARRYLEEALELASVARMRREEALALEFLGELAFDSGLAGEAMKYYERASEVAESADRHVDVVVEVLRRRAEAMLELGRHEEALSTCKAAARLAQSIPERYEAAIIERVAGSVHLARGERERGLARLQRSHSMLRHIGQNYELARTSLILGNALADSPGEGSARAKEFLLEARYLFGQVGSAYWVRQAEAALVKLFGMKERHSNRTKRRRRSATPALSPEGFGLVGCGRWLEEVMAAVASFADSKLPVLIEGESGTGKDMVARALHLASGRRERAYIPINCGALPDGTQESELFGYVKGAFTGALSDRPGCFESADGGTLFLDEIAEMTWATQVRLLRVLEAGEVRRVGEAFPRSVDVRIVAATNGDLLKAVGNGTFRKDLYYRLAGVRLHLPPLRERREDIGLLISHFLGIFSRAQGKQVTVDEELMRVLLEYDWPGNVRQLRNEIERMVTMCEDRGLLVPEDFSPTGETEGPCRMTPPTLEQELEELERRRIIEALRQTGWNKARAAGRLGGMKRTTLLGRMKKLGIPYDPPPRLWAQ